MPKCSFCGETVPKGKGTMFVYVSGKIDNFCSSKCEKHQLKLKRKPLRTRWTAHYRKEHKKTDSRFEPSSAEGKKGEVDES